MIRWAACRAAGRPEVWVSGDVPGSRRQPGGLEGVAVRLSGHGPAHCPRRTSGSTSESSTPPRPTAPRRRGSPDPERLGERRLGRAPEDFLWQRSPKCSSRAAGLLSGPSRTRGAPRARTKLGWKNGCSIWARCPSRQYRRRGSPARGSGWQGSAPWSLPTSSPSGPSSPPTALQLPLGKGPEPWQHLLTTSAPQRRGQPLR